MYPIIKLLLSPEGVMFFVLSAGCVIAWASRWPSSARFMLCLLLVLFYGFTTRLLSEALIRPLETYYRPPATMPVQQDAIVIFVAPPKLQPYTDRPTIVGTSNTDLLVCGLIYSHAGSAPKVVLTGESPDVFQKTGGGTTVLQEWAVLLGYPADAIITEDQGVATHERAHALKQLLGSDSRILLLDSAMHLPRSAAAFRKVGFTVTPIPCFYEMSIESWDFLDFVPRAENLKGSSAAVHEYLGLLTYWLRGLI